ncbi:MAG: response regulator [Piscinibacter sp.]|nr:response regulator [Piscinibacter sp.]
MPLNEDEDAQAPGPQLKGKLLCIEDSPIYLELIESALAAFPGIVLLKALTGREGIRLAREERPDLVLLDMHLPDISGLEVVRVLNEEIASGALRVTLLTADSLSMDIVKAMSLGASEYWLKPLTLDGLENGLRRALMR